VMLRNICGCKNKMGRRGLGVLWGNWTNIVSYIHSFGSLSQTQKGRDGGISNVGYLRTLYVCSSPESLQKLLRKQSFSVSSTLKNAVQRTATNERSLASVPPINEALANVPSVLRPPMNEALGCLLPSFGRAHLPTNTRVIPNITILHTHALHSLSRGTQTSFSLRCTF
jgi:hypothetical protein